MSGKVVLITGASSGIGRLCAERLHGKNWRVFGASRSAGSKDETFPYETLRMNVDEDASVSAGIESLLARAGRLDAVVNCAGSGLAGALEETSIEEAKALFETNFFGVLRVCRAALPIMRGQRAGRIVNIGSVAGVVSLPFEGIYSATKFALEALSETLRMEAKPFGVHVSLIQPGDFRTGFTSARKRTEKSGDASAYAGRFEKIIHQTSAREQSSPTPEKIALLLERVLSHPAPRLRYRAGPGSFAVPLKKFLPEPLFEWGTKKFFGME